MTCSLLFSLVPSRAFWSPVATLVSGALAFGDVAARAADAAFMAPPKIVSPVPPADYAAATRNFQGIPSLARAPGGRLWATWYGGPGKGEDFTNYVIVVTSGDDGKTWSDETLVVDPDGGGPVRAFDPELWVDPTGKLWVFWAQAVGHDASHGGVWAVTTENPDAAQPRWSAPRRLTDGVMMCKPTVLSTGEWVLPASTWRKTDSSARIVVSTDRGATWTVRGAAHVPENLRDYDEHMIVERRDGSLWMLVRLAIDVPNKDAIPQFCLGESVSTDRGRTWTTVARGKIPHVRSRFFISRLASGNLLLVKHRDDTKARNGMSAFLSKDDGRTWSAGFTFEERSSSYPDGVQAPDGRIYITYDRERSKEGAIHLAVFTEADVAAGRAVSPDTRLQIPIARMPVRPPAKGK